MISTKNLITDLNQIPREWVFEYYLNLKEKLSGQDVKILSIFNARDKVPSMFIYYDVVSRSYKFKDFSSGNQGDSIELVKALFNMPTRGHATYKILEDYQIYIKNNTIAVVDIFYHDKYKVVDYEMRHWTNFDQTYWMGYKIGSKMLDRYNVIPLSFFTMSKLDLDGAEISYTFRKNYVYGYFRNDGSLYKIYMPKNTDKKFIKVENYIQGTDQLRHDCKYLLITSSLKDLMAFNKLGISNIEAIAPDSENTMIGEKAIGELRPHYEKIIVLFDNDEPGIKAAQRYKDKYGFNTILLPMEKDLSDSVKEHGMDKVREILFPLLKQAL
jgi:hypothetical protein